LTYHDAFDRLLGLAPSYGATAGPARPVGEIAAAALSAAPAGHTASQVSLPAAPGEPAMVRVAPADAGCRGPRARTVAVDPATLAVLGTQAGGLRGVTRLMHDLHGHIL